MKLDGFRNDEARAFSAFDPKAARFTYAAVDWLSRKLNVEINGAHNIPKGRALFVANHAFGWDVMFPMAAVWRQLERPVWVLGEHLWWEVPFVRKLAAAVGT